eukprot:GHVU01220514.1.p1 GENE.GHVU01220514.1~~GHVU01220514.1.p1  ORF type:complete len:136 (-),score=14.19 GHVU01220514.1:110-517(-)
MPRSSWFSWIAGGCASTLEELWIDEDGHELVEEIRMLACDFKVLRKVGVWGKGASTWCATMVAIGFASTVEELTIRELHRFEDQLPGEFTKLRRLTFEGHGAETCRVTVGETCVQTRNEQIPDIPFYPCPCISDL